MVYWNKQYAEKATAQGKSFYDRLRCVHFNRNADQDHSGFFRYAYEGRL